jgi:hypothetical protein
MAIILDFPLSIIRSLLRVLLTTTILLGPPLSLTTASLRRSLLEFTTASLRVSLVIVPLDDYLAVIGFVPCADELLSLAVAVTAILP